MYHSRDCPQELFIGDIKVFPFFNSHSIYDSHMFLIEADGNESGTWAITVSMAIWVRACYQH